MLVWTAQRVRSHRSSQELDEAAVRWRSRPATAGLRRVTAKEGLLDGSGLVDGEKSSSRSPPVFPTQRSRPPSSSAPPPSDPHQPHLPKDRRPRPSRPLRLPTRARLTGTGRQARSEIRQQIMEHFWSRADATHGNSWQSQRPRKRLNYLRTVANACHQSRPPLHGKEGVDGSSPSEGSTKSPEIGGYHGQNDLLLIARAVGVEHVVEQSAQKGRRKVLNRPSHVF